MSTTHAFIDYVADRAASREIEALADFYGVGTLIVTGELSYDDARDQMVAAFKSRTLAPATAKTYVSQGYCLAQLFDTFEDVEAFADDECGGSRSLKRIYDTARKAGKDDDESGDESGEAEPEAATVAPTTDADRADAILAILSGMSDAAAIARVRDASAAMLVPAAA